MEDIITGFIANGDPVAYVKQHHYAIQNHKPLDFRPYPEIKKIDIFLESSHWNQPIYLHSGVIDLTIGGCLRWDQPLDLRHCHDLEKLDLYDLMAFNHEINFPEASMVSLCISNCPQFNQPLDLSHTEVIETVELPMMYHWNQPLRLSFVDCLRIDSETFNQPIDFVKTGSLTELKMDRAEAFNQPLSFDNAWLIRKIELGDAFNQPLDLSGCYNLSELRLGNSFNQPITFPRAKMIAKDGSINLKTLELGHSFQQPLDLSLAKDLETLLISPDYHPLPDLSKTEIMKGKYKDMTHDPSGLRLLMIDDDRRYRDEARKAVQYMKDHNLSLRDACYATGVWFDNRIHRKV